MNNVTNRSQYSPKALPSSKGSSKPGEMYNAYKRKMEKKKKMSNPAFSLPKGGKFSMEGNEKIYTPANIKSQINGAVKTSTSPVYKKKNWIAGAIKHPGALHRQLGVPQGEKIPAKKLNAAAKKGGVMGKRAALAKTLKGFKHKKNDHDADDKMKKGHGYRDRANAAKKSHGYRASLRGRGMKKKHVKMAMEVNKASGKKQIKAIVKIQKSHEQGKK